MSTGKRIIPPYELFNAQAVSGTNTYTSVAVNTQNMDTGALQLSWTGTPTGQFTLSGSVKGDIFIPLPSFTVTSPTGSAGKDLIDIWGTGVFWLQLSYTNASGSGTITAWIGMKAF